MRSQKRIPKTKINDDVTAEYINGGWAIKRTKRSLIDILPTLMILARAEGENLFYSHVSPVFARVYD